MATITIDPVNRIEGHLKAVVEVTGSTVTDAALTGTMFRGFEMILNRRDPRDAPILTQRICGVCPTAHQTASVMCLDNAFGIVDDPGTSHATNGNMGTNYVNRLPANGRIIRNLIHGADTVMSHITHLYHLSALDYVSASFLGAPWSPSYTKSDILVATGVAAGPNATVTAVNTLVAHYVDALAIRRKCHTAAALFNGRQPIGNSMVPGGVTRLFGTSPSTATTADPGGPYNGTETRSKFKALMKDVRNFINLKYIPDVLTVAHLYGLDNHPGLGPVGLVTSPGELGTGIGCKRFLSYGAFDADGSGSLLLKRGSVDWSGSFNTDFIPFDQNLVKEYVESSYYNYGTLDEPDLHPFDGKTNPIMKADGYSWLKAPRYDDKVHEVGPLARMVINYVVGDTATVNDADCTAGGVRVGGAYTVRNLISAGLNQLTNPAGTFPQLAAPADSTLEALASSLGRHAARALECKFIADAMTGPGGWVDQLVVGGSSYTYFKIPKTITAGYGLVEVPRGSLGHWIKVEGRKIAKYQCVVPTTWNASPKVGTGYGPAEAALMNSVVGANATDQIVNILRILHPFDFCIACAVHVVTPEGNDIAKFAIGADGRPTNIEVKE